MGYISALCSGKGYELAVRVLLDKGTNVDVRGESALHRAIAGGDLFGE